MTTGSGDFQFFDALSAFLVIYLFWMLMFSFNTPNPELDFRKLFPMWLILLKYAHSIFSHCFFWCCGKALTY